MSERPNPTVAEILEAMEETMLSLESVLCSLTAHEWAAPTGCPGWDVHDVVSHITGVENDIAGVPAPDHALPDDLQHVRDEHGRAMEFAVDYRRVLSPGDLLNEYQEVTRLGRANRRTSTRDPEEMTDGPFGWRMAYWQLLRIRTFDLFAHEQDIRRAVHQPGNLDGKAAALLGGMFEEMLPGLVPGRVKDLADRTITIQVTEPAPMELRHVKIGSGDQESTAITLPFSELLAFICGRADVQRSLVEVAGDADLAERVLASMAVTP
jgi:uncharacterized protein (TIGR03083 family)